MSSDYIFFDTPDKKLRIVVNKLTNKLTLKSNHVPTIIELSKFEDVLLQEGFLTSFVASNDGWGFLTLYLEGNFDDRICN